MISKPGRAMAAKILALIEGAGHHPFTGAGKPEPLKGG
jgi:Txe/YoeB family toxin of Txe-Axe toxin-antitoxin module